MTTLDDAWAWYNATREGARRLTHLAKHWASVPWDIDHPGVRRLHGDGVLGPLESHDIEAGATTTVDNLDGLAVLVLFSIFEAQVREWIGARVRPEVERLQDPTLKKAGEDVLEAIDRGSFARLLEPYKRPIDHNLVEEVNQVRRYRNWVAHGGRPEKKSKDWNDVTPAQAYSRLTRFLDALRGPAAPPSA
jgi:hypothetical protein